MTKIYFDKFQKVYTLNCFIFVILTSILFFLFFDILIFEFTRNVHGHFFSFFKHVIDPLSDILDPLHVSLFLIILLMISNNFEIIAKNSRKICFLEDKTALSRTEILSIFNYYRLIIKHCLISIIAAGIICNALKYILGVARPKYFFFENAERLDFFNIVQKMNSFPSGHSQAAFTLAALTLLYVNRFSIVILLLASLMAISRIFMSMHFPSDIIFGAYIGLIIPLVIYKHFFYAKFKIEENQDFITLNNFSRLLYWKFYV